MNQLCDVDGYLPQSSKELGRLINAQAQNKDCENHMCGNRNDQHKLPIIYLGNRARYVIMKIITDLTAIIVALINQHSTPQPQPTKSSLSTNVSARC